MSNLFKKILSVKRDLFELIFGKSFDRVREIIISAALKSTL